jgi:aspartyl-tRNA(Asn)/glutamyl-tRNA(Gln) amidotransferase subunit B
VLGQKVEIKNLNSFRAVKLALDYEAVRQRTALERCEPIAQETRLWDARALKTASMRSKEEAADYRYFPEPDLVPFVLEEPLIARLRESLPELPQARSARFQQRYGLSAYDAGVLTQSRRLAELFEEAVAAGAAPKPAANWLMGDALAYLNDRQLDPETLTLRPEWLVHLLEYVQQGRLSGTMAKDVFLRMLEQGVDPAVIVEEGALRQVDDPQALEAIAEAVLQENPQAVEAYLKGKSNVLTHLMGQTMKRSHGTVHPQQMRECLTRKLAALAKP